MNSSSRSVHLCIVLITSSVDTVCSAGECNSVKEDGCCVMQAEELGCAGKVEEAQGVMKLCDQLKDERTQLEQVLY